MRTKFILPLLALLCLTGCSSEYNRYPTVSEANSLDNVVQLTGQFAQATQAQFSPDLQWIAFCARLPGEMHDQIYLAPLRSSGGHIVGIGLPIRITPDQSSNASPMFSPTGVSLLFSSTGTQASLPIDPPGKRYLGNLQIFRADGWESAIAGLPTGGHIDLAQHPLTTGSAAHWEASYTSDAQRIVYTVQPMADDPVSDALPEGVSPEVYVMNADGSGQKLLWRNAAYPSGDPGRLLVNDGRGRWGVEGNFQGNKEFFVRPAGDGQHLICAADRWQPGQHHLQLMRNDGSHKTRLSFDGNNTRPIISRDGRYLLWTSDRTSDHSLQIFVGELTIPKGS